MIFKLAIVLLGFASVAKTQRYGTEVKRVYTSNQDDDHEHTPQPYQFAYDSKDDNGVTQFRKESGDSNGRVKGSYGYKDENGIERIVEYVADEHGYRAHVKTNEPGTLNRSPASIDLHAEPLAIEYIPPRYGPHYESLPYAAGSQSAQSTSRKVYSDPRRRRTRRPNRPVPHEGRSSTQE